MIAGPPTRAARIADVIALLEPRLSKIADSESFANVQRIAASLPGSSFVHLGFERRLGRSGEGLDFSMSLSAVGVRFVSAAGTWRKTATVVERCAPFIPKRDAVWLEFDTASPVNELREANVFVPFRREPPGTFSLATLSAFDRNLAEIEAFCDALPLTAGRIFVGLMLARDPPSVRFCAMPLTTIESLAFLEKVGWLGDRETLAETLGTYDRFADSMSLHVDLTNWPNQHVGIELVLEPQPDDTQLHAQSRWPALLDCLVARGLASREERTALLGWPAEARFEASPLEGLLTPMFSPEQKVLHGTLRSGLHHVKLILPGNGSLMAKAYFGATMVSEA